MKFGLIAVLVLIAAIAAFSAPDVKRYNDMRRM
jgi:hypothetical protein